MGETMIMTDRDYVTRGLGGVALTPEEVRKEYDIKVTAAVGVRSQAPSEPLLTRSVEPAGSEIWHG